MAYVMADEKKMPVSLFTGRLFNFTYLSKVTQAISTYSFDIIRCYFVFPICTIK